MVGKSGDRRQQWRRGFLAERFDIGVPLGAPWPAGRRIDIRSNVGVYRRNGPLPAAGPRDDAGWVGGTRVCLRRPTFELRRSVAATRKQFDGVDGFGVTDCR